jgi:hypothetical protein
MEINERLAELELLMQRMLPDVQRCDMDWLLGQMLTQQLLAGETIPVAMKRIWNSRYIRIPVSVREFVNGPRYLNLPIGESGVYPKIVEALERLFEGPYSEVVLARSIGWGKSTFGTLACAYDRMRLSPERTADRVARHRNRAARTTTAGTSQK